VLSKCDQFFWPPGPGQPGRPDPITYDPIADAARPIVRKYLDNPRISRHFYIIEPVAGLVGLGAETMCSCLFEPLKQLSEVEPPLLVRRVRDAGRFAREEFDDTPVEPAVRRLLVEQLGPWGIFLACMYLREDKSEAQVRQKLLERSGIAKLRQLIMNHFGNRAALIKLDRGLEEVSSAVHYCRLTAVEARKEAAPEVDQIASTVEDIRTQVHGFAELMVLAAHYNGNLSFQPDWQCDLLAVTGENGVSVAARLRQPDDASPQTLAAAAHTQIEAWARRCADPTLDEATSRAARTLVLSYERLARRIKSAQSLLESAGM
jgi:hypothetical protein